MKMKRILAESAAVDLNLEFQKPVIHFQMKFLPKLQICIQSLVITLINFFILLPIAFQHRGKLQGSDFRCTLIFLCLFSFSLT